MSCIDVACGVHACWRSSCPTLRPKAADKAAAEANTISTACTMGLRWREDGPPFALVDSSAARVKALCNLHTPAQQ